MTHASAGARNSFDRLRSLRIGYGLALSHMQLPTIESRPYASCAQRTRYEQGETLYGYV